MSIATLRINKYEEGFNCKTLCVNISKYDESCCAVFGDWTESILPSYKETEKCSRVTVKVASDEDVGTIDFNSCFQHLSDTNTSSDFLKNNFSLKNQTRVFETCEQPDRYNMSHSQHDLLEQHETKNFCMATFHRGFTDPLDQSLRRVNQNNARIMANIDMLNRALRYTQKKEMLDNTCPKSTQSFSCESCGKCYVYETGLRRHRGAQHAAPRPRWQSVWTCTRCYQVWPARGAALRHSAHCRNHALAAHECVREIKTSLLLQCEFCEKVYTSIPRLLRHSKTHTIANNYRCEPCGLTFASYRAVERHWTQCQWLNANYCFSLPKMLLCNTCDRKFRSYEQLYNHRYKSGHFMNKSQNLAGGVNTLGSLVYQCELCSYSGISIPQIITHKNQHHAFNETNLNLNYPSLS